MSSLTNQQLDQIANLAPVVGEAVGHRATAQSILKPYPSVAEMTTEINDLERRYWELSLDIGPDSLEPAIIENIRADVRELKARRTQVLLHNRRANDAFARF